MNTGGIDVKRIGTIFLGLAMVLLGFVILYQTGVGSVLKLYNEMQAERKDMNLVTENIATLKKVNIAVVNKTEQVFIAMPDRSLVPLLIANMKTVSENKFVTETVRSDTTTVSDPIKGLSLIYEGNTENISSIIDVIDSVQAYAPLTAIEELSVKESSEKYKVTLQVATFWADLPTELPQIKAPVTELSDEENNLMNEVAQFKKPNNSTLNPQGPVNRANPFI